PLTAPGGGHGRGNHVLDAVPGAGTTVVTGRPAAVLDAGPRQGVFPVLPQEVAMQPGGDVLPRQELVRVAVPVHVVVDRQPMGRHRFLPQRQAEVLRPLLKGPASAPYVLDD